MQKRIYAACYAYWFIQPSDSLVFPGFFVDINLFKANKEKAAEISMKSSINESDSTSSEKDDFADEDANLMVKLKFLTYKVNIHVLDLWAIASI